MSDIILLQGSMNPQSRTRLVLDEVQKHLKTNDLNSDLIDIRDLKMEFCDGRNLEDYSQDLQSVFEKIKQAKVVVIGMPVYCWSVSGPLKNFLDITAEAFDKKPIAIACNAGSPFAYLAASDLMKILSFESNALPLQPIIKTSAGDFEGREKLISPKVFEKIAELTTVISHYL